MFNKKALLLLFICYNVSTSILQAQIDNSLFKRTSTKDSVKQTMNMDAVYDRPMLTANNIPIAIGGYMEANWQHLGEDGISEGHQFQFRRFTMFMSSTISKRIKFMSELEFEDGTREINVEFAAVDFEFNPLLNLRGGIILNPIGAFNQNHDGPKWEFTDRPISAAQMLPSTWSNAGFGLYGKHYNKDWMFGYEAYISGGFDGTIINNEQGKTFLGATKENLDRFDETPNGEPMYTTKIALKNNRIGELGLSYMGGVYSSYQDDGLDLEDKRSVHVFAIDFNTTIRRYNTFITGEWAWVNVDVPTTYTQQYGEKQQGGFVDIVQPVLKGKLLGWDNASLNLACRLEYVDWNKGKFRETGDNIGDDTKSIMGSVSFRPNTQTVLRLNYRHQRTRDYIANPPVLLGGFSFGLSTYF